MESRAWPRSWLRSCGPLLDEPERVVGDEAAFLARVVELGLGQVPVELDLQSVIADRLQEVEVCFENGAYLAVVILCGSTLEGLLNCSRELGLLGEDVTKFGHAVREFRNYIHPQQQVRENFRPRKVTA